MTERLGPSGGGWQGIPRSPRALCLLVGTSLLAGLVCATLGGGIAHLLGLSAIIAGSVSGVAASVAVAVVILRYGQTVP